MDEELLRQARFAAVYAHVPHSGFPVGAVVVGHDGQAYRGCNVESASFGLTVCAERVAIYAAIASGAKPVSIAVSCTEGDLSDSASLMPCGACRQVMIDHMDPDAAVFVDGVGEFTVKDLMPKGFRLRSRRGEVAVEG
ncbi:MAG: cytidine deaminase [Chloroflexota bacterium]|nr:MAG: cytidine deaminase [Chloroflexota bacterium]